VSRTNSSVPITPSTSHPPTSYIRVSNTPSVPVSRRNNTTQQPELTLVDEVASPVNEIPVPGQPDELRVALPPSPPQNGRPRGSSLSSGLSLAISRIKRDTSDGSNAETSKSYIMQFFLFLTADTRPRRSGLVLLSTFYIFGDECGRLCTAHFNSVGFSFPYWSFKHLGHAWSWE
jgi:hypothetical protein